MGQPCGPIFFGMDTTLVMQGKRVPNMPVAVLSKYKFRRCGGVWGKMPLPASAICPVRPFLEKALNAELIRRVSNGDFLIQACAGRLKLFHIFAGSSPSAMNANWLTTNSTSHLNAASVKP